MNPTPDAQQAPVRLTLAFTEWPEADRAAWEAAVRKGDALDPGGPGEFWSDAMQRAIRMPYGRWLGWLHGNELLQPGASLGERAAPELMVKFVDDLRQQIASVTVSSYVTHLYIGLRAMAPERDWTWLQRIKNELRRRARPVRNKRKLVVPADELFAFGLALMAEAEKDETLTPVARAVQFRDGLMIAMLAARPVRLKNFSALRIGHELVYRADVHWIILEAGHTKTHAPVELPYPTALTPWLHRYLSHYRRILLEPHAKAKAPSQTRPPGMFLWVSEVRSMMGDRVIYQHLVDHTRSRFGHAVNPQLFRDCVATTIAIEDPVHVGITQNLLGHASPRTAERFYNHAHSLQASRSYQSIVLGLRRKARAEPRRRAVHTTSEI